MGWIYLVLSLLGLVHAVNALAPRKGSPVVMAGSFMAAWLTIELAWHHLVMGVLFTLGFAAAGALGTVPGIVGLVVMVVTEASCCASRSITPAHPWCSCRAPSRTSSQDPTRPGSPAATWSSRS